MKLPIIYLVSTKETRDEMLKRIAYNLAILRSHSKYYITWDYRPIEL